MLAIRGLERWSKPVVFKPGEVLVRQGETPGLVRLLTSGVAKVTVVVEDRSGSVRSPLVALRTSGSVLGAVAAVLGGTHVARVTAITHCEARALPVDTFCRMVGSGGDPEVGEWLIHQQAQEIREQIRRASALATKSLEDHFVWVIVYLFQASHDRQPDGSLALAFPLTVTDIAHAMGAGRSPVSTIASNYVQRQILLRPRRDLWVIPPRSRLHRAVLVENE